jgi:hypothetical protein
MVTRARYADHRARRVSIYQSNPDAGPDSDYEPGTLHHLVAGNRGRLLDPRRTPVTITDIQWRTGQFVVRIEDFEDRGARWTVPFEHVGHYQFERQAARASADEVRELEKLAAFDRPLRIEAAADDRTATEARLSSEQRAARSWLAESSEFLESGGRLPAPETRVGDPRLWRDLQRYMEARDLLDLEAAFAVRFVSNPYSGELVKGHRVVLAEMGLVTFEDTVVRDPDLFDGDWSKARRAAHIEARLGFLRGLMETLGLARVTLHRGVSTDEPLTALPNRTFVSSSFSDEVARSHFMNAGADSTGVLLRQAVPVGRLFMTYLETEAMNAQFREAEAVLLRDEGNRCF